MATGSTSSSLLDGIVRDLQDLGIVHPPQTPVPQYDPGDGGSFLPPGSGDTSQDPPYYLSSDPNAKPTGPLSGANIPQGGAIDPNTGALITSDQSGNPITVAEKGELFQMGDTVYRWNGEGYTKATAAETKAYKSGNTSGSGTDNTVGLANVALRGQELAETQRSNRMAEVMAAQKAIQARIEATQQARLEGAKFAVTPSMAASGYFPGLTPTSPLVRSGLADPFKFQPTPYSPNAIGAGVGDAQLQADLARIRGSAGYG